MSRARQAIHQRALLDGATSWHMHPLHTRNISDKPSCNSFAHRHHADASVAEEAIATEASRSEHASDRARQCRESEGHSKVLHLPQKLEQLARSHCVWAATRHAATPA